MNYEQKLYDAITESAKKELGNNALTFAAGAVDEEYQDQIIDNTVWGIINRLLIDMPKEQIAYELRGQFLMLGMNIDIEALKEFVADKDEVFKKQIGVARLATNMLNDGMDELTVYSSMVQLL